jgi:hypothetical protein
MIFAVEMLISSEIDLDLVARRISLKESRVSRHHKQATNGLRVYIVVAMMYF